jgi:hypothetical protein
VSRTVSLIVPEVLDMCLLHFSVNYSLWR